MPASSSRDNRNRPSAGEDREQIIQALQRAADQRMAAIDAQQAATNELADLVVLAQGTVPIAEIARRSGLTRKAIYDLIAWRTGRKTARH